MNMSYPPPSLYPGLLGYGPPPGMPPPPLLTQPPPPITIEAAPQVNKEALQQSRVPPGERLTVFVGNISERAPDNMVRQMLMKCGTITNWKRVQGANGRLQAFGFCDFESPEGALRSIRILHDYIIAEKKLVVKVDASTRQKLMDYQKKKFEEAEKSSRKAFLSNKSAESSGDEFGKIDEDTAKEDTTVISRLQQILYAHHTELNRPTEAELLEQEAQAGPSTNNVDKDSEPRQQHHPRNRSNLDALELPDEQRSVISREINKFREAYKENEKEDSESKTSRSQSMDQDGRVPSRTHTYPGGTRTEYTSARRRDYDYSNRSTRDQRDRERDREHERERRRSRSRSRGARGTRYRSRSRSPRGKPTSMSPSRERKRQRERKEREKEAKYQAELKSWKQREKTKKKLIMDRRERKRSLEEEDRLEAKRLKNFLQDYDDDHKENGDQKYYRGSWLRKRLNQRSIEAEYDTEDRQRESNEIQALAEKLTAEKHPNPMGEAAKFEALTETKVTKRWDDALSENGVEGKAESPISSDEMEPSPPNEQEEVPEEDHHVELGGSSAPVSPQAANAVAAPAKRKVMTVADAFNTENDEQEENDVIEAPPKRRLVKLDDTVPAAAPAPVPEPVPPPPRQPPEDKKKDIKKLIDSIPTGKEDIFNYEIDWSVVDTILINRRIRPWINKKIVEYIGEEEKSLTDFICSKILSHSQPTAILEDVAMVLDEEAEVFSIKLWRLLIYEVEAKKIGVAGAK